MNELNENNKTEVMKRLINETKVKRNYCIKEKNLFYFNVNFNGYKL